jgi:hypothetical protein
MSEMGTVDRRTGVPEGEVGTDQFERIRKWTCCPGNFLESERQPTKKSQDSCVPADI